jgi:preprotein translocase subunit YajC
MKSKQLFLILFILVLIGIAMTVVITRSQAKAVEANRNALTNDLLYYAAKAREFYWRPTTLGGGNRSFFGVTLPMLSNVSSNANGRYFIVGSPTKDEIVIKGIGTVTEGKDTAQVQVIINEQNNSSWIIR